MDGSLSAHYPAPQLHDSIFTSTPYPPHSTLASQHDIDLDPFHFDPQLETQPEIHHPHERTIFEDPASFVDRPPSQPPRFHEIRPNVSSRPPPPLSSRPNNEYPSTPPEGNVFGGLPRTRQQQNDEANGGQFGVLSPHAQLLPHHLTHHEQLGRLQHEFDIRPAPVTDGGTTSGHFSGLKIIPDPPNLDEWRQKLFNVDEVIALTEEE